MNFSNFLNLGVFQKKNFAAEGSMNAFALKGLGEVVTLCDRRH